MSRPEQESTSDRRYASAVFLVFVLSFLIRVGGIPHHEPMVLHADEAAFVRPALRILTTGDFNPHWFGHPGSLTIYCLTAVYALTAFFGGLDATQLAQRYADDPTLFHVLGKYVIVLSSMCTQWGLWLLSRNFLGRWAALLVVALLACTRLDIELAATIRTDTQQSALLVFITLVLVQAVHRRRHASFVTAGVLLGWATAVKWPSVVAAVPIVLSAFLANTQAGGRPNWRRASGQLGLAAAASVIGLFIAAPYVFLDWSAVLADVANESRSYHLSSTSRGFWPALAYYGHHLASIAGVSGLIVAGFGAVSSLRGQLFRLHLVPLCMGVTYLLFLCMLNLNWPRWTVPLLPYPCLYLVVGIVNAAKLAQKHVRWSAAGAAIAGACSAVVLLVSSSNLKGIFNRRLHDDAYDATQWVVQHVPPGSKVLVEDGGPYLPRGRFNLYEARSDGRVRRAEQTSKYHPPGGKLMKLTDMRAAVEKMDYVILGNVYKRLKEEKSRYRRQIAGYDWVKKHTQLDGRFGQIEVRRIHPTLKRDAQE